MPNSKHPFLNFQVDHMTLLVDPRMYNMVYIIFRILFGVSTSDVIYEKKKEWITGSGEKSMTYAVKVGINPDESSVLRNTIIAVVQPSEPESQPSHVREMLKTHVASAHWQHIALRTNDLLSFHKYAIDRGVNFITPILKDKDEDVIQVFSGEWYLPGEKPSGLFFEFVQRNPSDVLLKKLEEHNRQSWFKDTTFLGLYGEKEREYQAKKVIPFIDQKLFEELYLTFKSKNVWDIKEEDINKTEQLMLDYAKKKLSKALS